MKKIKHLLAILMTVTMIVSGGGMDGFAALSYATEDQDAPAVTQEQKSSESDAVGQEEAPVMDTDDVVKDEPSESSDTEFDLEAEDGDLIYELEAEIKLSDKSNWIVTAVYGNEAGIPEGAELYIEEIDKKDHNAYLKNTIKALKWTENEQAAYSRFLNISIKSNGKVVKPAAEVEIMVTPDDVDKEDLKMMQVVRFDNSKLDTKAKAEELECDITKDNEVVFATDEFAVFGFAAVCDADLVHKTIKADKVKLEGMMPEDAKATAKDASGMKAVKKLETKDGTALAAYDITIKADGAEYQPDSDNPILVQISNQSIKKDSNLSIWHIKDNGKKEQIKDFTVSKGKVTFEATGFSVYVVIDHEEGTVVTPRVEFHFIDPDATEQGTYYEADPYSFLNKAEDAEHNTQTTQILKDGESLEQITDPPNITDPTRKDFYGWYVVTPYTGSGASNSDKLYYTWPKNPDKISFESPISIEESDVAIGTTVNWSMHGVSGSGKVDKDGNVHVYLAPLYENYNFVNFMLRPRSSGNNSIMARKLVVKDNESSVEVKISDISSTSSDAVHLIFTGWEYFDESLDNPAWVTYQTVDYSGAEMTDPGKDGVYLSVSNIEDNKSIDLYPHFVQARWVDFVPGISGSGASYVNSRFLEAHGAVTPEPAENKSYFSTLDTSTRAGYSFDGWYAFAKIDSNGEITNLTTPAEIVVNYIDLSDYSTHTVKVNTTAIKVADSNGSVNNCGTYSITDNGDDTGTLKTDGSGNKLFEVSDGHLIFFDSLDRLQLTAKWKSDASKITVVYWTENAQEEGYTAPEAGKEKDDYTAGAVKTITTTELGQEFTSGSTVTLEDLQNYEEDSCSILARDYLGTVGAVPKDEAKFYDLKASLSDQDVVINGDGSTVFNVYFERMTFKLVFHIGRDKYVKNSGHQKTPEQWDGNWIEFMFKDPKVTELGYPTPGAPGRNPGNSQPGIFKMTYIPESKTYTSEYVTTNENVMGDYDPVAHGEDDVYVITAKYGAYIGDRWPTPTNENFRFEDAPGTGKTMYIWAAYYGSLYCRIANERSTVGNPQGANPDINGVYSYMSAELCSNRAGTAVINDAHVHHLVAYYGNASNQNRYKQYHILYEAIDGTYDPDSITPQPGTDYVDYPMTTWTEEFTERDKKEIIGHEFYELTSESPKPIISNLEPKFQLSEALDGYDLVYSCYDEDQHYNEDTGNNDFHIYFFYKPKEYTLTFMYENEGDRKTDTYAYKQSLEHANKYPEPQKEGYEFLGWYTNEAGQGEPFGFSTETMPSENVVLYPVSRVLKYPVRIDPNGGVIDRQVNPSMSTYFTASYNTQIGEYSVSRDYVKLTDKELDPQSSVYYAGDQYYYINMQFIGEENGGPDGKWGYPQELRNAIYVTADGLDAYYNYYCEKVESADQSYWEGIEKLSKPKFIATYTDYPYRPVDGEHYTFMGWYQVFEDGTEDTMPYNFNDPVKGPVTLRANWRLDGGYYVKYNPDFLAEDDQGQVTEIVGELEQWTDPAGATQVYADQTSTHILRAPTNYNSNWVFRGWRMVRQNGTITYQGQEYPKWEPMQLDDNGEPIYYQPGDKFLIDSQLISGSDSRGGVINMQAYYEPVDSTYRRPKVTNLILDANTGYDGYVDSDAGILPALPGSGSTAISGDQILFGDIQSEIALHLYKYATEKSHYGETGKEFFKNNKKYLLLGFDPQSDPEEIVKVDPRDDSQTGAAQPYIPNYPVDSVISVQRTDDKTLYAIWEPMLYATFVNTTDKDITVTLSGEEAGTVSVVNQVTGEFDRQQTTNVITIPAKSGDNNGEIKVVFPCAKEGDKITATAVNNHVCKKMTVKGTFDNSSYGTGDEDITYGGNVIYSGGLKLDEDGIIVEYSEKLDAEIIYDVNGGNWTANIPPYKHVSGDVYALDANDIPDTGVYEPSEPTHDDGKIFVGWTTNKDIADHTDFSSTSAVTWENTTITPDEGSNVLEKLRTDPDLLWDFSKDPALLYDTGLTLYAVWSDTVTVTFDILKTGATLHSWNGPDTTNTPGSYVFYRSSSDSSNITYTLMKGEVMPAKPNDPTSTDTAWIFNAWLKEDTSYRNTTVDPGNDTLIHKTFDFSDPITQNITLSTSWMTIQPQFFTFTVRNDVISGDPNDTFDYTIAITDELVWGKKKVNGSNDLLIPNPGWGSVTTTLKNNETYKVQIKVTKMTVPWTAYSVGIDVYDNTEALIKSGQMVYCPGSTGERFHYSSDYKYTLLISQEEKAGYTTTVGTESLSPTGGIISTTDDARRSFTFISKQFSSTGQAKCKENFGPNSSDGLGYPYNSYDVEHYPNNSITVVFTNTGSPVAPTGYNSYIWPLIWMLLLGMFLWTAMTYMRKRRGLDGYAMEAAGIDGYDGFDAYEDAYDDYDAADSNADMEFAVNETSEEGAAEVRGETSENSYEAFDWTRIVI